MVQYAVPLDVKITSSESIDIKITNIRWWCKHLEIELYESNIKFLSYLGVYLADPIISVDERTH